MPLRPVAEDLPEPVQSDRVEQSEEPAELEIDPQHDEAQTPSTEHGKAVAPPANSGGDAQRVAPRSEPVDNPDSSGTQRTATEDEPRDTGGASSSTSSAGATDPPAVTSKGIPLDSPLLPWRRSHKDPVSVPWLDS